MIEEVWFKKYLKANQHLATPLTKEEEAKKFKWLNEPCSIQSYFDRDVLRGVMSTNYGIPEKELKDDGKLWEILNFSGKEQTWKAS